MPYTSTSDVSFREKDLRRQTQVEQNKFSSSLHHRNPAWTPNVCKMMDFRVAFSDPWQLLYIFWGPGKEIPGTVFKFLASGLDTPRATCPTLMSVSVSLKVSWKQDSSSVAIAFKSLPLDVSETIQIKINGSRPFGP